MEKLKSLKLELEDIQIKTEQLASLLLACEQTLRANNFSGEEFAPALCHLVDLTEHIQKKIEDVVLNI